MHLQIFEQNGFWEDFHKMFSICFLFKKKYKKIRPPSPQLWHHSYSEDHGWNKYEFTLPEMILQNFQHLLPKILRKKIFLKYQQILKY